MKHKTFTASDVDIIAALAKIPIRDNQAEELALGFTKTMEVVDTLEAVDVTNTPQTNQVTGLENVFREDVIDESRILSQDQIKANKKMHNGFFVVDQILEEG